MTPPVLLILFRRPEQTRKVFEAIREARPEKLFLAADGPRRGKAGEDQACRATRETVANVDWPCEVKTFFREANAGIRKNVSEAISWFLDAAGEGIILEDDCLPSPDFFRFAADALERYRDDTRIMQISGSSFCSGRTSSPNSYFFSRYNHGWGWATWRRAWNLLDLELASLDAFLIEADRTGFWDSPQERKYWAWVLRKTRDLPIDTWDYQWKFTLWKEGGLALYPLANLVTNLGFGDGASNTTTQEGEKGNRPFEPLGELVHPRFVLRDKTADQRNFRKMYWGSFGERLFARMHKVLGLLGMGR